ncbi:hypothetical protein [Neptuniibacter sp.]|uniref:hypothetical protein n=1 Tax=Neptuniibacter sp. TaxID=1962643 RepID=UPI00261C2058|nr:hypothetical protein [Neptuniibacter sp.]MCP4597052.1 hypothetical protein [Neptuniibacter sp.]
MSREPITFDKGINLKKGPLFLGEDELISCSGWDFRTAGQLSARPSRNQLYSIDTDSDSTVHGFQVYDDSLYAASKAYCLGDQAYFNYIYHRLTTGTSWTNVGLMGGNAKPRWANYLGFTFAVDGGANQKAFLDDEDYTWGVENPTAAPEVVVGAAEVGGPDGTYYCYVTFYVIFPNGHAYETGASSVGTVEPSENAVEWSGIPTCGYAGDGLDIRRRLYRSVSGINYLVKELMDNTTTTFSDVTTDATLQASSTLASSQSYPVPGDFVDVAVYIQRIFGIKGEKLYWTETYAPFSYLAGNNATVSTDGEDLVACVEWGDQLYIATTREWKRLQGNDPDTWALKYTFADNGVINRYTVEKTKYGILGLWYDGIYLFDGVFNKNITEKYLGTEFFTDLDDLTVCFSEYDGDRYYFYYASSSTTVDKCLVLDMNAWPEMVFFHDDFIADAHKYDRDNGTRYLTKSGYEYYESGTETISTTLQTGDRVFKEALKKKNLEYLYYDIDTGGADVVVTFYVDGTADSTTMTLNTTSRERKRSTHLHLMEGYRHSIKITCSDSEDVVIYAPWALEASAVGD